jgi:uncharacterized membrane protein YidH (DUF202 family)
LAFCWFNFEFAEKMLSSINYERIKRDIMKSETIRNRIPYIGAGLVILTTLILAFIVIPGFFANKTPGFQLEPSVKMIIVTIILHLLILYAFMEMIIVNKRGGRLKKIVFIITGIGLFLLGLFLSDGAFAGLKWFTPSWKEMSGHAYMQFIDISWFICVANDFIAGILVFIALFLQPKKVAAK